MISKEPCLQMEEVMDRKTWDCKENGHLLAARDPSFCLACDWYVHLSELDVEDGDKSYCTTCVKNLLSGRVAFKGKGQGVSQRGQADDRGSNQRTPHVCPKCNGEGKVHNLRPAHNIMPDLTDAIPEKCHPCRGTGIVWG